MLLINTNKKGQEQIDDLIAQITKNQNVKTVNQQFTIRFIENWIDENTEWIVINDVDYVSVALFNFVQLEKIYIKPNLKIPRPKLILTSTLLSAEDFEPLTIEVIN